MGVTSYAQLLTLDRGEAMIEAAARLDLLPPGDPLRGGYEAMLVALAALPPSCPYERDDVVYHVSVACGARHEGRFLDEGPPTMWRLELHVTRGEGGYVDLNPAQIVSVRPTRRSA